VSPRATVVVPAHDKPHTLPLAVDTVLRQTVSDLEVILLGDGVTDEVRAVVGDLVARDPRVRFLDFPKGPHHGEKYRHDAILAAESDAIFYLCDDDLLLPEHVADLLGLLETANFAQSLNGFTRPDGTFGTFAADLATATSLRPIVRTDLQYNAISITGTAHSRAFYLAVGEHWDTTPEGEWPDRFQWRRMIRHPDFRGATSRRMTALQLPTSANGRESWTPEERLEELARWHAVVVAPGGQDAVDAAYARGAVADLARLRARFAEETHARQVAESELETVRRQRDEAREALGERDAAVRRLRSRLRRVRAARRLAQRRAADLESSRSWRLTAPFRVRGRVARWIGGRAH
jgi:hypothetical protein